MKENVQIKEKLDKELENLHFTKQAQVLSKIQDKSWKMKLKRFWNKEIQVPLLPVSSIFVLMIFGYGFFNVYDINQQFELKQQIEYGGSKYWVDDVEELVRNGD